jgi:hypothetical protein
MDGEVYCLPNRELVRAWVLPDREQMPNAWDDWGLTPSGYGKRLNMLARLRGRQPGVRGLAQVWLATPERTAGDVNGVEYQVDGWTNGELVRWVEEDKPVWTTWDALDLAPVSALGRREYWEKVFGAWRRLRV